MAKEVDITAVPAIAYLVLFSACFFAVLVGMMRQSKFDWIWLYPLAFVVFRMVTLGLLAAGAFGAKVTWDMLSPELILTLALTFLAKMLLFGPAFTMFTRQFVVDHPGERKSYKWNGSYLYSTMFAFFGAVYTGLALAPAALDIIHPRTAGMVQPSRVFFVLKVLVPVLGLLATYSIFYWMTDKIEAGGHYPNLHSLSKLVYILAALVTVADIQQLVDVVTKDRTGKRLSIWYFYAFQILAEFIMTILVIYSLLGYKRPVASQSSLPTSDISSSTLVPLIPARPHSPASAALQIRTEVAK